LKKILSLDILLFEEVKRNNEHFFQKSIKKIISVKPGIDLNCLFMDCLTYHHHKKENKNLSNGFSHSVCKKISYTCAGMARYPVSVIILRQFGSLASLGNLSSYWQV
jgi:hypothetical protein